MDKRRKEYPGENFGFFRVGKILIRCKKIIGFWSSNLARLSKVVFTVLDCEQ